MYINKKELKSLQEAIDFISTNADGADDYTHYKEMKDNLRAIWLKGRKQKKVDISKMSK